MDVADEGRLTKLFRLACDRTNPHEASVAATRAESYLMEHADRVRLVVEAGTDVWTAPLVMGQQPAVGTFMLGRLPKHQVFLPIARIRSIPLASGTVVFEVRDTATLSRYALGVALSKVAVVEL